MKIREANRKDMEQIWPIFHEVVSAGNSYPYPPDTSRAEATTLWFELPQKTFIVEDGQTVLGTYYLKPNQPGLGGHVCNCGYMVAADARGKGVATALCEHSQAMAKKLGYQAMQFNLVVATNSAAVRLWNKLGFTTTGTLPKAFKHQQHGYVDALVMYKWLAD